VADDARRRHFNLIKEIRHVGRGRLSPGIPAREGEIGFQHPPISRTSRAWPRPSAAVHDQGSSSLEARVARYAGHAMTPGEHGRAADVCAQRAASFDKCLRSAPDSRDQPRGAEPRHPRGLCRSFGGIGRAAESGGSDAQKQNIAQSANNQRGESPTMPQEEDLGVGRIGAQRRAKMRSTVSRAGCGFPRATERPTVDRSMNRVADLLGISSERA